MRVFFFVLWVRGVAGAERWQHGLQVWHVAVGGVPSYWTERT